MRKFVMPAAGLATAGLLVLSPLAVAAESPEPTCAEANAALAIAIDAVLDLAPDVYPGDTVPAPSAVNPDLLRLILRDPDLGGGGGVVVEAALAAFVAADQACAPAGTATPTATPTATLTPDPTPTIDPTVTLIPAPTDDPTSTPKPRRVVPRGGVNTGA